MSTLNIDLISARYQSILQNGIQIERDIDRLICALYAPDTADDKPGMNMKRKSRNHTTLKR